jgi:hypothetical protein
VNVHTQFFLLTIGISGGLFLGMLGMLEVGRRIGVERARTRGGKARAGVGVVDGAVYSILAFLLGFTFSGAADRFNQRRQLVGEISNAISTAWRRIDMLPDSAQPPIRVALLGYTDQVIEAYQRPTAEQVTGELPSAVLHAEDDLWARSVAVCKAPGGEAARMLLLPSLNEIFDDVDRERMARLIHPPMVIFMMLAIAALSTAMFAGYGMASGSARNWIFNIGIAATVSITTYVILELEYPRLGLFRVSSMDQVIVELRRMLK